MRPAQLCFSLPRQQVIRVEALLRWNHPEHGLVFPDAFLPVADEAGLLAPIGEWVLGQACRDAIGLQSASPDGSPLQMSVNFAATQLTDSALEASVAGALDAAGLAPALLTVEVTESGMMSNIAVAQSALAQLREIGVRVSIDDFGTGYSSLSHLSTFQVDELKIDRSFVASLQDQHGLSIVEGICGLGRAIDAELVAEGVETAAQAEVLRGLGCDVIQGWLIAKAAPLETTAALIRTGAAIAA